MTPHLSPGLNTVCLLALALLAVWCSSGPAIQPDKKEAKEEENRSLVIGEKFGKVENGSAFDKTTLDLGKYKKVVLPDKATVLQEGDGAKLQIFMKKTLHFLGHPPEAMSIRQARKYMGCAVKAEKDAQIIATFGEWDSHIEGGQDEGPFRGAQGHRG